MDDDEDDDADETVCLTVADVLPTFDREECAYVQALRGDPIKAARELVTACRGSGQRREQFALTIREGNAAGTF